MGAPNTWRADPRRRRPSKEIELTRIELDAQPILATAGRSKRPWDDRPIQSSRDAPLGQMQR
jgi:hypothetical protein